MVAGGIRICQTVIPRSTSRRRSIRGRSSHYRQPDTWYESPKSNEPLLKELPRGRLNGICTAVFDTSYKMSPWLKQFPAAKRLKGGLKSLGGKMIVKPETFHVMESEGPLYEGEIERAQDWAAKLAQMLDGTFS